jgi:uncharacterized protein
MRKSNMPMFPVLGKLDVYDLLFLILKAAEDCQRISGRTTIQKIGYFACEDLDLENDYAAHFYGPYSPALAYALKRLVSLRLVKEERTVTNNDHVMFEYSLTPMGKKYADKIAKEHGKELAKVGKIVERVGQIEEDPIDTISKAAKVHFLKKDSERDLSAADIVRRAKNFGWNIDRSEVLESLALIKEI